MDTILETTITMIFSVAFMFSACSDDDDQKEEDTIVFDYQAHIHSPNTDAKHLNDSIHFHIEFESHKAETIHHINIKVYNKADNSIVIYNEPQTAHLHETDGAYEYHDDFVLSEANGVTEHSDWILEAKVWGPEAGVEEEIKTIEFHVHPE